jgi:hypothetical protein
MPIRLNLLAEAHALEEMRRRDPVKRVLWVALLLVVIVLGWSSSLLLRSLLLRGELNRLDAQVAARTNDYRTALENQGKLNDVRQRLGALYQLTTNRFLQGSVLNALQQTIIDDVQLTRFRTEQVCALTEATKPTTNLHDQVVPGRPAKLTEKITMSLDAKDCGPNPGDQIAKFRQSIAFNDYFQKNLGLTNEVRLANLSPPQFPPGTKPFVLFTLECRLPERTR